MEFSLGVSTGMAAVAITQRRVDVTLAAEWDEEPCDWLLRKKAKHEVFHIVVGRLSALASKRSASADELYDAEEELVERLLFITAQPGEDAPAEPDEPTPSA
jgi:hypothetical protein